MSQAFDLIVVGGGPGGYVAALRAGRLGLKVCLIEKEFLGGVCLNRGCIPSKTLLAATELFGKFEKAGEWGIEMAGPVTWNLNKLFEKKDAVIQRMRQGLEALCQKRKVFLAQGTGRFVGPKSVEAGGKTYTAGHVILASGSLPRRLDLGITDKALVFSSEEALSMPKAPASVLILGGGPEGCEFALIYRGFGSGVTLVEAKDQLLPGFDRDAGAAIKRTLVAKGVEVVTGQKLLKASKDGDGLTAHLTGGEVKKVSAVLVCVGRVPNTKEMGLESLGLELDPRGAVITDKELRTNIGTVYAIGDVTGNRMMAHSASYEGYVTAGALAGKKEALDYRAVPSCVYTYPEVAEVGLNEEKALSQNIPFEIGRFSFMALGRSHAKGQTEGFVKIIGHAKTNEVLGGVIVGEGAPELINPIALCIQKKLKVEDLRSHIAPHPSASEAVTEAAHLFFKEGLHFA